MQFLGNIWLNKTWNNNSACIGATYYVITIFMPYMCRNLVLLNNIFNSNNRINSF